VWIQRAAEFEEKKAFELIWKDGKVAVNSEQ